MQLLAIYTALTGRGIVLRSQLLAHNSPLCAPLFYLSAGLCLQRKGSGCHFASSLCGFQNNNNNYMNMAEANGALLAAGDVSSQPMQTL
ncbi:hypothetical protein EYF80_058830 [Liparis tanakae]|uniref:Uncharacterized protein n=1 Tax=Liparis tanakae TaxID=230148 RepID=A0A4Z2EQY2_9TELE|nr:hypothetical protein EYF80_058830 [Liparis tanakae]